MESRQYLVTLENHHLAKYTWGHKSSFFSKAGMIKSHPSGQNPDFPRTQGSRADLGALWPHWGAQPTILTSQASGSPRKSPRQVCSAPPPCSPRAQAPHCAGARKVDTASLYGAAVPSPGINSWLPRAPRPSQAQGPTGTRARQVVCSRGAFSPPSPGHGHPSGPAEPWLRQATSGLRRAHRAVSPANFRPLVTFFLCQGLRDPTS